MGFDYDPCEFCPYDTEYTTYNGTVCENCSAKRARVYVEDAFAGLFDDDGEVDPF